MTANKALPPNPVLKSINRLCSQKEVDFLQLFDSSKSGLYETVRHRYNQLNIIVMDGLGHLRLFTKHLQKIINAQKQSADACLQIVEEYRKEEPTLSAQALKKLEDDTTVTLPNSLDDAGSAGSMSMDGYRKTDIDVYSDIFGFDRNMAKLFSLYWKRVDIEIYQPLYQYRKSSMTKLETIRQNISSRYEKLIKTATKIREEKVKSLALWNDLCDARHALRKSRTTNPSSQQTKKCASKVNSMTNKVKKLFESTVEYVDKFNNVQDDFWNIVIYQACLQLEAIEYSRICFYTEYFNKYQELLQWRRAELENGERTLLRSLNMLMTPFEIAEYAIHPIRVEHGNYRPIPPLQYELPCMPTEIEGITDRFSEQRIDPGILAPVYNPFGDDLNKAKAMTTRQSVRTSRQASMSVSGFFDPSATSITAGGFSSDQLITRSASDSIASNATVVFHPDSMASNAGGASFFGDNQQSLFSRTHRAQTHTGGLPTPLMNNDNNDNDDNDANHNNPDYNRQRSNPHNTSYSRAYSNASSPTPPSANPKPPIWGLGMAGGRSRSASAQSNSSNSASGAPRLPPRPPPGNNRVRMNTNTNGVKAPPLPDRSPKRTFKKPNKAPPSLKAYSLKQQQENSNTSHASDTSMKPPTRRPPLPKKSIKSAVNLALTTQDPDPDPEPEPAPPNESNHSSTSNVKQKKKKSPPPPKKPPPTKSRKKGKKSKKTKSKKPKPK